MPETIKPYGCQDHPCLWNLTRSNGSLQTWMASFWETFWSYNVMMNSTNRWWGWNSSNVPISFDSHFSGNIYYKWYHLGRNFQQLCNTCFWQTDHYATVNLDKQMLRNAPGHNGEKTAACLTCHHVLWTSMYCSHFCGWKAINQNRRINGFLMRLKQ